MERSARLHQRISKGEMFFIFRCLLGPSLVQAYLTNQLFMVPPFLLSLPNPISYSLLPLSTLYPSPPSMTTISLPQGEYHLRPACLIGRDWIVLQSYCPIRVRVSITPRPLLRQCAQGGSGCQVVCKRKLIKIQGNAQHGMSR